MNIQKKEKKFSYIFAPLLVVKEEKFYFIWLIFIVFFGLINIWAGIFLGKVSDINSAFEEGIIYTYSISILSPFLAEILLKQVVKKKTGEPNLFLSYQMWSSAINVLLIVSLTILWLGENKGNVFLQCILGLVSSIYSFYMYCIGQMELHQGIVGKYDDDEYLKSEKKRMEETEKSAKEVTRIEGEGGDITL